MNFKNEVVQFNENHKWCGCLGIVEEVKKNRIMVGIPAPEKGTAYIFARPEELERIGVAAMVPNEGE